MSFINKCDFKHLRWKFEKKKMVLSSLGVGANATTTAATNSHRPITIQYEFFSKHISLNVYFMLCLKCSEKSPIKQRDALFVDIFERLTMQLDVK